MILLIGTGIAADVPFVFDETSSGVASYNSDQIEQGYAESSDLAGVPMVTQAADDEVIAFPVTGGSNTPEGTTEKKVRELKEVFNARVEPDNSRVHEEALVLVSKLSGDLTIDRISSIYSYLKNGEGSTNGWSYARDPRGIDYFMYANQSLRIGERTGCVGTGDCDDFAILMSALIESIGGTTRIILARNNTTGGHAYTEVYLGNLNEPNNQVEDIISWLKEKFDTDKIYTHIDTATKDVWLNLDWGPDEKGNTHPGGPFYQGDKHIVLLIRDRYEKTALKLSEPSQAGDRQSTIVPPGTVFLTGHSDTVRSVAFSPDGRTLASGSNDNTIKLWDIARGTEIRTLKGHSRPVESVAFSPDGRTLASGSDDSTIKLWDTTSGTEIRTPEGIFRVAFSPDNRTLATGYWSGTIKLWDTASGTEIRTLKGLNGDLSSVAFSSDGLTLATGSSDCTIRLWDIASGAEIRTMNEKCFGLSNVAFSPDGRTLAWGSEFSASTILWDTASGSVIRTLEGHSDSVTSVAFSPDGRTLASGSSDCTIKLWDTASGTEIRTLEGHSDTVMCVAFSPDSRTLASGGGDGTIRLWRVA